MEFHEVANIFPMMTTDEYRELVEDIRKNGQKVPIETYQGLIIDGRNRYKACTECGIEPQYKEWNGIGSLVEYVVSLNMKRRDLTKGQRAAIGLDIVPMLEEEAKERQRIHGGTAPGKPKTLTQKIEEVKSIKKSDGEAKEQAAKIVGTNRQYLHDAEKIKEQSPDLAFPLLKEGKIMMNEAKVVAKQPKEKQNEIAQLPPRKQKAAISTLRRNDSKEKELNKTQSQSSPPQIQSENKVTESPQREQTPPSEPTQSLLPLTQYQKDKALVDKVMWEATKRNIGWSNPELLKEFNTLNKPLGDARIYIAMIDKFPEMAQFNKYEVLAKYKELPDKDRPILAEPGIIFDGFADEEQHEAARMERFMLDVDRLVCDLINNPDNTHFQSWKKFSAKFGRVERTRLLLDRVNQLLPILQEELGGY